MELALAGYEPQFLPQVRVSSHFSHDDGVTKVQKSRWEHGHLATMTEELPRLLGTAFKSRKPALIVMALDLLIPPVALYFLLLMVAESIAVLAAILWPVCLPAAALLSTSVVCFFLAIGLTWWRYGRHLLNAQELMKTPLYAFRKIPVYLAYLFNNRSGWVRTKREV